MKKFDVTKHSLVPKHTKLSDKEKKQLLEHYNITINELPKIAASDSAIKELGLKAGDIVKVQRRSKTAAEALYYRGVINA